MTCRCATPEIHAERERQAEVGHQQRVAEVTAADLKKVKAELAAMQVKTTEYEVQTVERVGKHLVLRVKYPSCAECGSYDGVKVMVYLNVGEMEAMTWRRIDPHFFRGKSGPGSAPSPAARFPASDKGWKDAINYAKGQRAAATRKRGLERAREQLEKVGGGGSAHSALEDDDDR